ncbi:MAG TPA: hypothetical protein VGL70_15150 [Candidatus Binatia bacterium]|jgi:hypothetical protein
MATRPNGNKRRRLPPRLYRFFWDVYPRQIDLNQQSEYVIARLLEHGDLGAIQWVLKSYSKEHIANVVKRSRQLSRKTANFWRLRLAIPRATVYALKRRYLVTPEPFY